MATLAGLLRENAERSPDGEALVFGERRHTWREVDDLVGGIAAGLASCGLTRGARCALMAANSDRYLLVAHAVWRLGAILVPINTRLAPPEVAFILEDSATSVLVHDDAARATLARVTTAIAHKTADVDDLVASASPGVRRDQVDQLQADQIAPDQVQADESDDALILYTSGTTGRPKGVVLDHHREIWAGLAQVPVCGLTPDDRYLHLAPLYHGAGLTLATAMLLVGGTQIVLGAFEPGAALAAIETERATALLGVPTMFQLMLDHPSLPERDLGSWRIGIFGAAPMPASAVSRMLTALPGVALIQQCGQTEAGPSGLYSDAAQVRARPDASGRQALPYLAARVVDDADRPVAPGGVGELVFRGESVMKRYWGLPDETAEVLRGGWLRTGDVVRVDPDGFLTIVDRRRDVILTGGRNVYSVEVENALRAHPDVADCGVVGRPHPEYGETVVAVVDPAPGAAPTLADLRAYCAELIADYKIPREVVIAAVPRNASGKILKTELRAVVSSDVGH